jgi:hypothetical protein
MVVKVTTKSGNYWTTEINCTNLEGAKEYFLDYVRYYRTETENGKEFTDRIIKVEELTL